jgi:hypothetical protein
MASFIGKKIRESTQNSMREVAYILTHNQEHFSFTYVRHSRLKIRCLLGFYYLAGNEFLSSVFVRPGRITEKAADQTRDVCIQSKGLLSVVWDFKIRQTEESVAFSFSSHSKAIPSL